MPYTSATAVDIFARLGDIKGESLDARHKDVGGSGSGCGAGVGKATFQALAFVHRIDKASPALFRACATGQRLKETVLTHRKSGEAQAEYVVRDGQVNSETVSLAFGKVTLDYRPQKPDGSLGAAISFKFDLKTSKVL